jgi:hypothetical protein
MRILFAVRNSNFLRYVSAVLKEFERCGDEISVCYRDDNVELMSARHELISANVEWHSFDARISVLAAIEANTRQLRTYVHWLQPKYPWPPQLRERWAKTSFGFPLWLRTLVRVVGRERFDRALGRLHGLEGALQRFERLIPPSTVAKRDILRFAPDVVICTPVIYPSTGALIREADYLKAAAALMLPTVVMVASWDNLPTKGVFPLLPSLVLVWNELQRQQATELHKIPPERVAATGAPIFDDWHSQELLKSRRDFLMQVGLTTDCLLVFYAVSSDRVGDEMPIVRRLTDALRRKLACCQFRLLVRPHPNRSDDWQELSGPDVIVWPVRPKMPVSPHEREGLYNSIYHSIAVVGVNTTVFVEAAILGRPCIAVTPKAMEDWQWGVSHFRDLARIQLIETVTDEEACAERIAEIATCGDSRAELRRQTSRWFTRPVAGKTAAAATADAIRQFAARATP